LWRCLVRLARVGMRRHSCASRVAGDTGGYAAGAGVGMWSRDAWQLVKGPGGCFEGCHTELEMAAPKGQGSGSRVPVIEDGQADVPVLLDALRAAG